MVQERERFANRFDTAQKEILVLTECSASASKGGRDLLWNASVTVLALMDVETGVVTEDKCRLEWQLTEEETHTMEKIFNLQGETIYRLKVQESLPFKNQYTGEEIKRGSYLWVKEVIERDCHEERLDAILTRYRMPVKIKPEGCEELVLDKSLGMFCGEGIWNGEHCQISLDVDGSGEETAKSARDTLKKLMDNCKEWDEKARKHAAAELTENANDWANDEDNEAEEITEDEFAKRLSISEICVSTEGDFEIYYDDDDMFWGHVVIVSGNIEKGIEEAYMVG